MGEKSDFFNKSDFCNCQLSTVNCQLSTINYQLSTINCQLLIMTTHFITAEIDLTEAPVKLPQAIESHLQKSGQPLRWAITEVDQEKQKVLVEAVVTRD